MKKLMISLDQCAAICYEMNRMYSKHVIMEQTLLPWEFALIEDRQSIAKAIALVLAGKTVQEMHESWMQERTAQGWTYGAVKSYGDKISPYLKSWVDLTPQQQGKNILFNTIVYSFIQPDTPPSRS